MYKVDLNCDLGEGAGLDSEIIPLISSANIACGYHAGDAEIMRKTIELCKSSNVMAGAHPGYPDKENFGRTNMPVTPQEMYDFITTQLKELDDIAKNQGVRLQHIKPHGAMYNMAAKSEELSDAICDAVSDFDSSLILLALSGSQMIKSAKKKGLKYASEVFADRAYEADGTLRARRLEGAMIEDEAQAISRVIKMIKENKVTAYSGEEVELEAHSVCVHGDGAKALDFVRALNKAFEENQIEVVPLSKL